MPRYKVLKAFGGARDYAPGETVDSGDWPTDNLNSLVRGGFLTLAPPSVEIDAEHVAAQAAEIAALREAIESLAARVDALEAAAGDPGEGDSQGDAGAGGKKPKAATGNKGGDASETGAPKP